MTALRHDAVVAKPHARQQYSGTPLRFPYVSTLKPAIGNVCGHPATPDGESHERLLVNFFYAPPVGHAVEALHYCLGHHLAHPEREISVVLNAASAVELAGFCPFVSEAFAVDHPLLRPCPDSAARQAAIPRRWDWVLDDHRRHQQVQLELFPGLRDYYLTSDRLLAATEGRTVVGAAAPGYVAHQQLRLQIPETARGAAQRRFDAHPGPSQAGRIAVMPAGSGDRALYPSVPSWRLILDALTDAFPGVQIALVGKRTRDGRTTTAFTESEVAELLAHRSRPLDCFDVPLPEQLAVVEASDVFLAPHTGFGMAALAVGTPWLALSGGRWFEFFFNRVAFRSIIPDPERYPSFTQFALAPVVPDSAGEPRTASMTRARIEDDLGRIVAAARELLAGSVTYEQCLRDYFPALVAAQGGDAGAIWSIDGVHLAYV
jgi:hypothetical protein